MDTRLKARWVKALRSGKYKQGTGFLRFITRRKNKIVKVEHCCLGVLCEVMKQKHARQGGFRLECSNTDGLGTLMYSNSSLPLATQTRVGLSGSDQTTLIDMNDGDSSRHVRRRSFRGIAQWIERNL